MFVHIEKRVDPFVVCPPLYECSSSDLGIQSVREIGNFGQFIPANLPYLFRVLTLSRIHSFSFVSPNFDLASKKTLVLMNDVF